MWWQPSVSGSVLAVYGHFGPWTLRTQDSSAPWTLRTQDSLVPKCLTFFCVGAEVSLGHFSTSAELSQHFMKGLPHWYRSVSDRSAARSCSCIASPPHVTSAPSIAIFRQRLKTYCIYKIIPDIHIWLITHFNNISLFPVHFSINYLGTWTMSMPPSARRGH